MTTTIVLASGNQGKLREFGELLAGSSLCVQPQSDFGVADVEETGLSFVENAIIKARHAAKYSGCPAIADDSGLVVDHLDGAPGIYSSRFAGANATDASNNRKLLELMSAAVGHQRRARFQCLLVFMRHHSDPSPMICQGAWEGRIADGPRGDGGFGYDPIFWLEELNCTAAELPREVKNTLSHRAQAMGQLLEKLRQLYPAAC